MVSTLVWTSVLFTALQCFLRDVASFDLGIESSEEDRWVKQVFEKQLGRQSWDFGRSIVDGLGVEHPSTLNLGMGHQVKFNLYTRKTRYGPPFKMYKGCKKRLRASGFNPKIPTKILIHGFTGGPDDYINTGASAAYLEKDDYNVIIVDWATLCEFPWYYVAVQNVPKVGEYVGKMVDFLIRVGKAKPTDIHIIGHSLGAHVAGCAGAYLGFFKIGRITGLDPAGIVYDSHPEIPHLTRTNALTVDVIHTNGGELGYYEPLGDIDFYPNGGSSQPGCDDFFEICNHDKAVDYFINSIRNEDKYQAKKCHSLEDVKSGNCHTNEYGNMGDALKDMSPGIYYVNIV